MKRKIIKRIMTYTIASSMLATSVNVAGLGQPLAVYAEEKSDSVFKEWNFDNGIGGWENAGWDWQYEGNPLTVESEYNMLKVNVDFSKSIENSWSQTGVREWGDIDVIGTKKTSFDLYYDPSKLTNGFLTIKEALQYKDGENYKEAVATDVTIDTSTAVDSDVAELAGWKKVSVILSYDEVDKDICNTVLCIVGKNTTYSGALYIDNIKMTGNASTEDIYVNSTLSKSADNISVSDGKINSYDKDKNSISTEIPTNVKLVDGNASDNTKAIYAYLKSIGESKSVIYGHQNDTWHKAGSDKLSNSDTMDLVGSVSGIIGIDALSITGNEYSAKRYNDELKKEGEASLPETPEGNVEAAAKLTNYNIEQGAIITMSAHMPNFSQIEKREGYDEKNEPTYAKYNFSGYTPNVIKGDVMNEILPGGKYNEEYSAYLDMIADYVSRVNGTVMFRPFHENTGSWFWWGKAFCDAATYKNVYKYTVEYLRDVKNIHNILYVYGPGSEAANVEEYGERYPGDNYVDMVGFDMYHQEPKADDSWFDSFKNELNIVNEFGKAHNKLIAVTETGVASSADKGDNQTALHKTGNEQKDWYNNMLEAVSDTDASYFLLWANFGKKDGFYTPYVEGINDNGTLHGHEMMDNFISFYNDPRSLCASEQKDALSKIDSSSITAEAVSKEADGYITAPVSGKRILDEVKITANTYNADGRTIKFVCGCGDKKVELEAVKENDSKTYTAKLDKKKLASLGEGVGTIKLFADNSELDSIKALFNMPEPNIDPYEIDGFENYFGEATLLQKEWATNKDSGCTIDISPTNEADKHCEGSYGLKFTYNEKVGGWAGATISKEVDWSKCNALKLWTIPDGNNQKTVIQITAGGKEYEAYLNDYEEYKNSTKPLYVTIPFSKFKDRDGDGPEGGLSELKGDIQSFGLWVNQIGDNPVEGTIYYDKITAVSTDKKNVTFSETDDKESKEKGKITGVNSSYKKVIGSKAFTLKAKGQGDITYSSSDKKVVTVGKNNGKVLVKGIGKAYITITASGNDNYEKTVKKIMVTITPKTVSKVSVKSPKSKKISVSWSKQNGITGYEVYYSQSKTFKKFKNINIKGANKVSCGIKNLSSKMTYYVRVRSYKTVGGKKIYGSWSSAKKVVVK
ncbi:MAG: fibronectin type III domain-containing protein [Lachnospiraceae bacterium]|nr:fibronectin type III domain-containing protein [Lachnospiraceae bacterium]